MFARAIAIERAHPYRRLSDRADTSYAALLKYADDLDGAEDRLCSLLEEARAIGDLSSISYSLGHLVHISLWRGQLARGRAYADEHLELSIYGELGGQGSQAKCNLGLAMAYQGYLDDADQVLSSVLADPTTSAWFRKRANATLGFVALSRNDAAGAAARPLHRPLARSADPDAFRGTRLQPLAPRPLLRVDRLRPDGGRRSLPHRTRRASSTNRSDVRRGRRTDRDARCWTRTRDGWTTPDPR